MVQRSLEDLPEDRIRLRPPRSEDFTFRPCDVAGAGQGGVCPRAGSLYRTPDGCCGAFGKDAIDRCVGTRQVRIGIKRRHKGQQS